MVDGGLVGGGLGHISNACVCVVENTRNKEVMRYRMVIFLVGLFFAALCAFLSSVLLIGESVRGKENIYIRKAGIATIVVFITGLITFIYGYISEYSFVTVFVTDPYAIVAMFISGLLLIPLWITIKKGRRVLSRFFAGLVQSSAPNLQKKRPV